MDVVVGRLGRPQGLRGEVTVEVRTDEPERRFAVGAVLLTRAPDLSAARGAPAELVVAAAREQSGRLVLTFEGVEDRTAAESLRNLLVAVDVEPDARPADPDEYYDHQLVGLPVRTVGGQELGEVRDVLHLPSQDVLAIGRGDGGAELLVPFVEAFVPTVDLATGVVVDPPPGLLGDGTEDQA